MAIVGLLQVEKSYAVDYEGKSYTVVERTTTNPPYTDYDIYALDGGESEISKELRHELIEAVKRFSGER